MGAAPRGKRGFVKKNEQERREKASAVLKDRHAKAKALKKREPTLTTGMKMGRRVWDPAILATELWCSFCEDALSLRFLESEKLQGWASILRVRCHRCLDVVTVTTDTKVKDPSGDGRSLFAVNCKVAVGCIDSGVAYDQLNKLASCINIPPIQRTTLKRAEDRVQAAILLTAKESCAEAIEEEKEATMSAARWDLAEAKLMIQQPAAPDGNASP